MPYISGKCSAAFSGPYGHEDCVTGPIEQLGEPDGNVCACHCHDADRQRVAEARASGLSDGEIRRLIRALRSNGANWAATD